MEHGAGTTTVPGCPHIILLGARRQLCGTIEVSPSRFPDHQWATGLEHQLQMVFPRVVANRCRIARSVALQFEEGEHTPVAESELETEGMM